MNRMQLQPTPHPKRLQRNPRLNAVSLLRKAMLIRRGRIEVCAMAMPLVGYFRKAFPLRCAAATCCFLENAD